MRCGRAVRLRPATGQARPPRAGRARRRRPAPAAGRRVRRRGRRRPAGPAARGRRPPCWPASRPARATHVELLGMSDADGGPRQAALAAEERRVYGYGADRSATHAADQPNSVRDLTSRRTRRCAMRPAARPHRRSGAAPSPRVRTTRALPGDRHGRRPRALAVDSSRTGAVAWRYLYARSPPVGPCADRALPSRR